MRGPRTFQRLVRLYPCGAAALALWLVAGAAVWACNVPVFRFALERWQPDPYRLTVLHRGGLGPAEKELLASLADRAEAGRLNIDVAVIDIENLARDDEAAALLEMLGESELEWPAIVAQYPRGLKNDVLLWRGPWRDSEVERLLDSPLRRQVVQDLAAGATAVWIVLESGDAEADEAAFRRVVTEVKLLEESLKLPELVPDDPEDKLLSQTPLRVQFSVLRFAPDDDDPLLRAMLRHCEADLIERDDPMVFPVFGRGRALFPLIGRGITADNVQAYAEFLCGACSCEVKDQNPGFDLLLAADWHDLLTRQGIDPELLAQGEIAAAGPPELVPIPVGGAPVASAPPASDQPPSDQLASEFIPWSMGLTVAIGVMLLGMGGAIWMAVTRRPSGAPPA